MIMKRSMCHQGLNVYEVSLNDDINLDLPFRARPNLVKIAYYTDNRLSRQVRVYRTISPLVLKTVFVSIETNARCSFFDFICPNICAV